MNLKSILQNKTRLKRLFRTVALLMVISVNVGCDQVSKQIVRSNIEPHQTISVIGNNLLLMKVENPGAAFSLWADLPPIAKVICLQLLPLLVLCYLLTLLLHRTRMSKLMSFGMACFIGGGIANIYDRIVWGSVTDFMFIDLGFFQTAIFNMADVSVTLGAVLIGISVFKERKRAIPSSADPSAS